jgi:hypothetical protein
MTRRRVDPALGSVRSNVRDKPMTLGNTENVVKRSRVDLLAISGQLERQPSL